MNENAIKTDYDEKIAEIGQALGHPYRIQILRLLTEGELCGCEIVPHFELDQSGISRHLNALRRAGLITTRRDGVRIYWRISSEKISEMLRLSESVAKGDR